MFSIDGTEWDMPCKITREASLTASEISGMMLDKSYFNDVIGMFLTYTVTIVVPLGKENFYSQLYEVLTDPVDGHTFVFPYNQDTVQITGRIEVVSDEYYKEYGGRKIWRKTSFTVTANHPTKTYTLGEAVARGLTPLPSVVDVEDGAVYEYHANTGWQEIELKDADEVAY